MPEYLAPGVYVEETSFRARSIEGVSTTTTGFIGPTAYGPLDIEPDIVTSLEDFERTYGGGEQLRFNDGTDVRDNYMWHAARAFFAQGGTRLYISRIFHESTDDGHARSSLPLNSPTAPVNQQIQVEARFPGAVGRMRVRFTFRLGQNVLTRERVTSTTFRPAVGALLDNDVVWIADLVSPINSPPGSGQIYVAQSNFDPVKKTTTWSFERNGGATLQLANLHSEEGYQIRVITASVTVFPVSSSASPVTFENMALDPAHLRNNAKDSLFDYFAEDPSTLDLARSLPIIIARGDGLETGDQIFDTFVQAHSTELGASLIGRLLDDKSSDVDRSVDIMLDQGGNDGLAPGATEYEGNIDAKNRKTGLQQFEDLEDISIVAAPGSTYGYATNEDDAQTIISLLIVHAQKMRYRIAVIDSGNDLSISAVRSQRAKINSKYAAFYYPWVRILDPVTRRNIVLPPSGFVAGIYARNDINRAVYKAPANEVVSLSIGFETLLNKAQQEVLNPEGINCFRFFEGRGYLLWGARMATDDTDFKYVNLRRYFAYLERSIDRGTQFAVFEPNGDALWANLRRTISSFLLNEWVSGALLGEKPDKAYFVRCDRTTMTQNDLDNGRLVCLIGVAPVRPAEFVIFRIGQFTADSP